jgi:hypothetical protein
MAILKPSFNELRPATLELMAILVPDFTATPSYTGAGGDPGAWSHLAPASLTPGLGGLQTLILSHLLL